MCNMAEMLLKFRLMDSCEGIVSDHSMLHCTIRCSFHEIGTESDVKEGEIHDSRAGARIDNMDRSNTGANSNKSSALPRRFKVSRIPDELMYSEKTVESCQDIIDELLLHRLNQEKLDTIYESYVNVYYEEMGEFFAEVNTTPHSKKSLKHTPKPYWNEELTDLWKLLYIAEKQFVKARKDSHNYTEVLAEFRARRRAFDKMLRREKRAYQRREVYNLEKSNTQNSTEFWRTIENLGPKRKHKIPFEVVMEDGEITDVYDDVMSKWKCDFERLLTPNTPRTPEQQHFWEFIDNSNRESEMN